MYKIYYHVPFKSINFHYYYLNSANSHTLHVLIAAGRNMKYMIVIMVMVPSIVCLYQVSWKFVTQTQKISAWVSPLKFMFFP